MVEITILGTGCEACDRMAAHAKLALDQCSTKGIVKRVTDVLDITSYNVAVTPALVINGSVVCGGRVPPASEIAGWLRDLG